MGEGINTHTLRRLIIYQLNGQEQAPPVSYLQMEEVLQLLGQLATVTKCTQV